MPRPDGRQPDELRPIKIQRGFTQAASGSVLISMGHTVLLCTASIEIGVPEWMTGKGLGWVTAEYDMLPASTGRRRERNRAGKLDGRTQEIQRLIGRSLRAIVDRAKLGENTIWLDCDVIQADGGTRTAGITGAYVALHDAISFGRSKGLLASDPIIDSVAAVSVAKSSGQIVVDVDYAEDSRADVDLNVVMTGGRSGGAKFVEVQGSAEGGTFDDGELQAMLAAARAGLARITEIQRAALAAPRP